MRADLSDEADKPDTFGYAPLVGILLPIRTLSARPASAAPLGVCPLSPRPPSFRGGHNPRRMLVPVAELRHDPRDNRPFGPGPGATLARCQAGSATRTS